MTTRQKSIGGLLVFTVLAQNYLAQVSHVPAEVVAHWTLHEWAAALLNVLMAGAITAKAYLSDSGATPPSIPPQSSIRQP